MSKSVAEIIEDNGFTDVVIFESPDYAEAFLGVSENNRAVYDYNLMVKSLCEKDGITEVEAMEFIEENTILSLSYTSQSPIILHRLTEELS